MALLLAVVVGFGLGKQAPVTSDSLGSQLVEVVVKDFRNGIKIGGSTFADGSRNLSNLGTLSSGVITTTGLVDSGTATIAGSVGNNVGSGTASSIAALTIGNSVTGTLVLGTANKPLCLAAPAFTGGITANGSAATMFYYQFTPTGVQATAAKPSTCP